MFEFRNGGLSVQVQGGGTLFGGSEGMFGSWDYGGARFRNGTLYDTTVGYAATALTSFEMAYDWRVPLADSLMFAPDDTCDPGNQCGPTEAFACDDVRRVMLEDGNILKKNPAKRLLSVECNNTSCDAIDIDFLREACETDVAITGDTAWACEPSKVEPLIVFPGPNDFIPHPTDPIEAVGGGGMFCFLFFHSATRSIYVSTPVTH